DDVYKLNLIPSGVLHPHITPVIGNGVVVNPHRLIEEIDELEGRGISCAKLRVSGNAHLVMPYHIELDKVKERYLGKNRLDTTKRGIGYAFADKAMRVGLRVQDLFDTKIFAEKLDFVLNEKNAILAKIYGRLPFDGARIASDYMAYAERLKPYVTDTTVFVHEALREGSGRDARGGIEFGTRTGRLRRLGWFDAVLMRYADRLNGFTELVITKLDVLSGYSELPVCTGYDYEGRTYREFPEHQSVFHHCTPEYARLPGWSEDISKIISADDMPKQAREYIAFLEAECGVPISLVSVGPERDQTLRIAA